MDNTNQSRGNQVLGKIFDWILHPTFSDGTPQEWLAGLVIILLASFMWHRILKQLIEA